MKRPTEDHVFGCVLAVLFLVLALMLAFVGVVAVLRVTGGLCDARWDSYPHRYDLLAGCQVLIDGLWTPADNVRVLP